MSLKSIFSHEVYRARSELGLTQQEVADAISISVRWYQYIEKGASIPGSIVMLRLILFLNLDVNTFWDESEICVPIRYRYRYAPVKESLSSPELDSYHSVGLSAYRYSDHGTWDHVSHISDISTRNTFVADLARRCTLAQLDPTHLLDVVMDSI